MSVQEPHRERPAEPARRAVRPLTDEELDSTAGLLDGIARRIQNISAALLAPDADHVVVADLRASLAHAGKHLLSLLHHGVLDAPDAAPPWLWLSLRRFGRRTRFDGESVRTKHGPCRLTSDPVTLATLIKTFIDEFEPRDPARIQRLREADRAPFRRRQAFLEASLGWLGRRLKVTSAFQLPRVSVFPAQKLGIPDTPLHLTLDLYRGSPSAERLLFLDVANLSARMCTALSKEVDRIAMLLRQSRVAPELINPSVPPTNNFHQLAVALLAECRSIIRFRFNAEAHEDWATLYASIPTELREPRVAYDGARSISSLARHEQEEAAQGTLYGAWIDEFHRDRHGAAKALDDAASQAELRAQRAAQRERVAFEKRRSWERALKETWLARHGAVHRELNERYQDAVRRLAVHVDDVGDSIVLGEWNGANACDLLTQISADLAHVLSLGRHADVWETSHVWTRLTNVKWRSWDDVAIRVRREAAEIVRRSGETTGALRSGKAEPSAKRGKQRSKGGRSQGGGKAFSDSEVLVLRALPGSAEPALKTLGSLAARIGIKPPPSVSCMSRAVKRLRSWKPSLVDRVCYRLTAAGEKRPERRQQ